MQQRFFTRHALPVSPGLLSLATGCLLFLLSPTASAQGVPRAKAVAPANQVMISDTLSGSYFVAKPLKEDYDRLLARLEVLKRELDEERVTGPQAEARLATLREELRTLRERIEQTKLFVPVAKMHTVKENTEFDLRPERGLLITADQVKLVGSHDAKVHCTLEKICLSAGDEPVDAELAAIKLVHDQGPVPALAKEAGTELQGETIDRLSLEGLTGQQGNRQITLEVGAPDAGRSIRSQWRRHAVLTVAVPPCKGVIVEGGLRGLDVEGVNTALVVTSAGGHDRDYDAHFQIRQVQGNVTLRDFPVNLIEAVQGNVSIDSPQDFANHGTQHANDTRLSYWYHPLPCRCANIQGNLHARFGRVNLEFEGIRGRIDVDNAFGTTLVTLNQPLAVEAHRLTSVSGRIEVTVERSAMGKLPMLIAATYGTIRTNTRSNEFPDFNIRTGGAQGRSWNGFRRAPQKEAGKPEDGSIENIFGLISVLEGKDQAPGLAILSQAGTIVFNLRPDK